MAFVQWLLRDCFIQERHRLSPRAAVARAKGRRARAGGNAVLLCPKYRFEEVVCRFNINERIARRRRLRTAQCFPQEGHDLAACAWISGAEGRRACARGNALLLRP